MERQSQPADQPARPISPVNAGSEAHDLACLRSIFDLIAEMARAGYGNEGRGAMIVDLSGGPEIRGGYLSLSRLLVELGSIPDETLRQTLQQYQPAIEFVAVVRRADRTLHGYILSY
jgi:hypothetical protein